MNDGFTFKKQERIVSQKTIDQLFSGSSSHSMAAFPVRAVYQLSPLPASPRRGGETAAGGNHPPLGGDRREALQILISVPKRHFKHAVDRNRVKRQVREAFRLHKQLLAGILAPGRQLAIAFIWQSSQHLPTAEVEKRIVSLMQRIAQKTASPPNS